MNPASTSAGPGVGSAGIDYRKLAPHPLRVKAERGQLDSRFDRADIARRQCQQWALEVLAIVEEVRQLRTERKTR
jgi:hypothetical protein